MAIKDAFIGELKHESSSTQKMLERIPLDKKEWIVINKLKEPGRKVAKVLN